MFMVTANTNALHSITDGKYKAKKQRRLVNGYFEVDGERFAYLNSQFSSRTDLQLPEQINRIGAFASPKMNSGSLSGTDRPEPSPFLFPTSMLDYVAPIKTGNATPEQLGRFAILVTNYLSNYPDIESYGEFTQFRVGMSLSKTLGLVDQEFDYEKIYTQLKKYMPSKSLSSQAAIQMAVSDGLLNERQSMYILRAFDIVDKNVASYVNEDIDVSPINIDGINEGFDKLIGQIQNDESLSKEKILPISNALTTTKYLVAGLQNMILSTARNGLTFGIQEQNEGEGNGRRTTGLFSGIGNFFNSIGSFFNHLFSGWGDCLVCLSKYIGGIIKLAVILAALGAVLALLGSISAGTLDVAAIITLSSIGGSIGVSVGTLVALTEGCNEACGLKKPPHLPISNSPCGYNHIPYCPDPDFTHFDGANCMYGWYAGPSYSACIYQSGYAFLYCPYYGVRSAANCWDGNANGVPFWRPGHFGGFDGVVCYFGWWDPGWTPFIYGGGFFVKCKCI